MKHLPSYLLAFSGGVGLALGLACCNVGPDYKQPKMEVPTTYKSAGTQPTTAPQLGQDWWRLFKDPELTAIEEHALADNQDFAAAVARVAEARASARAVKSQFYPTVNFDGAAARSRSSGNIGAGPGTTRNDFSLPVDLNYEVDIWGRVRRSYEAAKAQTQVSVDDLEVVRQTIAADVAQDYFTLHSLDDQHTILRRNVDLYKKQVGLVDQKRKAGLAADTDLAQVETLLDSTLTLDIEVLRQRADMEHALAILMGRAPAAMNFPVHPLTEEVPAVPPGLPADLLRRRPDVAEAEQNVIVANAQIGVATANFYPVVQLTGAAGFESIDIQHALDWESRIWSIGPSVTVPIFEGGQLNASLQQAKARYDELQATYRGTVLGAFRDVEDALTDLRLYSDSVTAQAKAVASAREYVRLSDQEYENGNGVIDYLTVIDADRTLLTNELAEAQLINNQLTSAVVLMKALGGGWDAQANNGNGGPATQAAAATQESTTTPANATAPGNATTQGPH